MLKGSYNKNYCMTITSMPVTLLNFKVSQLPLTDVPKKFSIKLVGSYYTAHSYY